MNERVKQLRVFLKLSQEKFANELGVSDMAISRLEHNQTKGSRPMLTAICAKFNVNENWLLHGEGDMFSKDNRADLPDEFAGLKLSPEDREFILNYLRMPEDLRIGFNEFLKKFGT